MYKKPFITLRDSAPWFAVLFAVSFAFAWAFRAVVWDAGWELRIVNLAVFAAFLFSIGRHFYDRKKQIDAWNASIKLGCAVAFMPTYGADASVWVMEHNLFGLPGLCLQVWSRYRSKGAMSYSDYNAIANALQGATVYVVNSPITLPGGAKAAGMLVGNVVTVVGPPAVSDERLRDLIVHELSHLCLFALGIPRARHEECFKDAGFGQ